jgi:type I restriction enzyme S subunit
MMHDLFTRGLDHNGKLRPRREEAPELYHQTALGWLPKEWEAQNLSRILLRSGGYLQTGPFGSQLHAHEYTHEGIPVVMPQDINDGKISTTMIAKIHEKRAQTLQRHRLKIGDIIIARRGELSRAASISDSEKKWVCGTGCFLLRLGGSKLNAIFFSYTYRHDIVQRQIAGIAVGTTMPSLNNTVMNALVFPSLDIEEQNEITDRLKAIEKQIYSFLDEKNKLNKLKTALMQALLTGRKAVVL